jgi:uncharacterized protein
MEVDVNRKRISLTMRLDDAQTPAAHNDKQAAKPNKDSHRKSAHQNKDRPPSKGNSVNNAMMGNAFAEAFAKAKK